MHLVGELMAARLRQIPQSQRVSYWHHSTLALYSYVCLQRI